MRLAGDERHPPQRIGFTFKGKELQIVKRQYVAGGCRLDIIDEDGCPYAVLTKHDADGVCAEGEFLVKAYAENVEIAAAVKPFFEDTGRRIPTGYVELEVWRLLIRMIKPATIGTSECPNRPILIEGFEGSAMSDEDQTGELPPLPEETKQFGGKRRFLTTSDSQMDLRILRQATNHIIQSQPTKIEDLL